VDVLVGTEIRELVGARFQLELLGPKGTNRGNQQNCWPKVGIGWTLGFKRFGANWADRFGNRRKALGLFPNRDIIHKEMGGFQLGFLLKNSHMLTAQASPYHSNFTAECFAV